MIKNQKKKIIKRLYYQNGKYHSNSISYYPNSNVKKHKTYYKDKKLSYTFYFIKNDAYEKNKE